MDVYVQITGLDSGKTRGVKALLDSGCSTCCIDTDYARAEKLDIQELPQPIVARNADNTENISGRITHYVDLRMRIGPHVETRTFLLTCLGKARIFIGLDWLTEHNPEVDWQEQTMRFSRCPERCHMRGHEEHQAMIDMDAIDLNTSAPDLEEGESILLIDFGKEVDLRLKETPAQKFAEEAEKEKERMTEGKIPDQYREFVKVFAKESFDLLPDRRTWDHAIELKPGSKAVDCKVYPLSRNEQVKLDEFLQENLASGRIRPSKSPMASAFFFVKKKDGSLRPVQDYRKLNKMTIRNRYPLPLISELVHNLCGAKFFTKLDIRWGYNNVRIKEGDEWKAAFRTNRGLYEPLVMFFGLTNSPATFQNMMNNILRELINEGHVVVYLDDILIFTENLDEHRRITKRVLELLQKHKLYLKPEKCEFERTEIEYLGVIIGHNSMRMDPVKIKGVMEWPEPKSVKQVQAFLGFTNFYRRFVRGYAEVAKPLTRLTGKAGWSWGADEHAAFDGLKKRIAEDAVLALPNDTGQYRLEADASEGATGSVLSQNQDGIWRPIAFISHALTETERNYEIYDKEMLAIMLSLDEWRQLLLGATETFEIFTDHQNLESFRKPQKLNRRQAQWITELAEFNFTLRHRPGALNRKADLLSRRADHDQGKNDNKDVTLLKPEFFRSQEVTFEGQDQQLINEIKAIRSIDGSVKAAVEKSLVGWKKEEGLITYHGKLYVPRDEELRDKIIGLHHDTPLVGHAGINQTQEMVERNYWWPRMGNQIRKYIQTCEACQRTKTRRARTGSLHPHAVPNAPWEIISMDQIGPLPVSNGYDAIHVWCDSFTKMIHVEPISTDISSEGVA
ncbi:unnamed protein product [Mycena citricolor]|uniref:RNA-directed DNA polymerase n=1 Tax=Mycena citricolor TaxID=2018698 RepID=A0AAD2HVQ1_9AGAR|nr:unnamed protein product [Mycena citricolor]